MTVTRKTVSLPASLVKEIEKFARKRKTSFSGAATELLDESIRYRKGLKALLALVGSGDSGLPDLGSDSERHLRELAGEWED